MCVDELKLEKIVDLILKFQEVELYSISEQIEKIEEAKSNSEKCRMSRTALEMFVKLILKNHKIEQKQGFFSNLGKVKDLGIIDKSELKLISYQYSMASKIVHEEKEDTKKNTLVAINGIFNDLEILIVKYQDWKDKNKPDLD